MDKNGKAPIMGRITVNRTMAQFSCKLSCTPSLWNPRASRLEGKSKEAVETNKDIGQLLLSIQKAFDVLVEKRTDFEAKDVKVALQGSVKTQTTLLSFVDEHISELRSLSSVTFTITCLTRKAFHQEPSPSMCRSSRFCVARLLSWWLLQRTRLFAHYRVGVTPKVTTPKALSMSDFMQLWDVKPPKTNRDYPLAVTCFLFRLLCKWNSLHRHTSRFHHVPQCQGVGGWCTNGSSITARRPEHLPGWKLPPEALELMAKYEDGQEIFFELLRSTKRKVRIYLITICKLAETSKTYSYHSGRHSFASLITLEAGVPMETICKMHVSLHSTCNR